MMSSGEQGDPGPDDQEKEGLVTPVESRVPGPSPGRNGSMPLRAPTAMELPPALRTALLDPTVWRERLEEFAHASNLAITLTDDKGQPLGEPVNSRSLGSRLHDQHPAAIAGCPSSLAPLEPHTGDDKLDEALAWQDEHLLAPLEPCTCVVRRLGWTGSSHCAGQHGASAFRRAALPG